MDRLAAIRERHSPWELSGVKYCRACSDKRQHYHLVEWPCDAYALTERCRELETQILKLEQAQPNRAYTFYSEFKQAEAELARIKELYACRWCGDQYLNVAVCSKCAFTKKQEPHYTAQLESELARVQAELKTKQNNVNDTYNQQVSLFESLKKRDVDVQQLEQRVTRLTEALKDMLDVVRWMSGSSSFSPEGEAHQGWLMARPNIDKAQQALDEAAKGGDV